MIASEFPHDLLTNAILLAFFMIEVPSQAVLLVSPCFWKFFIFPQNLLIGVIIVGIAKGGNGHVQ